MFNDQKCLKKCCSRSAASRDRPRGLENTIGVQSLSPGLAASRPTPGNCPQSQSPRCRMASRASKRERILVGDHHIHAPQCPLCRFDGDKRRLAGSIFYPYLPPFTSIYPVAPPGGQWLPSCEDQNSPYFSTGYISQFCPPSFCGKPCGPSGGRPPGPLWPLWQNMQKSDGSDRFPTAADQKFL